MYIHHTHDRRYKAREKARRRQSMAFRVQEGNRHAKVVKEKQDEVASATADNFAEIVSPVVVIGTVLYEMILNKYLGKGGDGHKGIARSIL